HQQQYVQAPCSVLPGCADVKCKHGQRWRYPLGSECFPAYSGSVHDLPSRSPGRAEHFVVAAPVSGSPDQAWFLRSMTAGSLPAPDVEIRGFLVLWRSQTDVDLWLPLAG